jgi:S-adenosylmethionine-diacylgycerolhomoserine-N-methlytransferase
MDKAHAAHMDAIYTWQRHIYDATRKYFLFGRDTLIADLDLAKGGTVLELGCGTGRNLALIGKSWPRAQLFGIDISQAMLQTARANLGPRAHLAQGDARNADPVACFGHRGFDRVVISYALSMIPGWEAALRHGADLLNPGGTLLVVDFADGQGLAPPLRRILVNWLTRFDVTPRHDLVPAAQALAQDKSLTLSSQTGPFRYYQSLRLHAMDAARPIC